MNACRNYQRAFAEYYTASPVRFLYASKAYLSPLIARLIAEQGMGLMERRETVEDVLRRYPIFDE